jgi:hypothetical protein
MTPVAAELLAGGRVVNPQGQVLGTIEDVMVDLASGTIAYAVLDGEGAGRFAVPWTALLPDPARECYVLEAPTGLASAAGVRRCEAA